MRDLLACRRDLMFSDAPRPSVVLFDDVCYIGHGHDPGKVEKEALEHEGEAGVRASPRR